MALRALVGKLRSAPAQEVASRAFSQKCEHCGKTSSRIAGSLGQKKGAIKHDFSEEFKKFERKQRIIRATIVVTTISLSWLIVCGVIDYLEDENFPGSKYSLHPNNECNSDYVSRQCDDV